MVVKQFTDQLKREIEIPLPPQKIISLVPSITELICDLGLETQLCGITKFCVHPPHIRKTKQIIGGTKNLRIEEIKKLNPDLIIANKEENEKEQVEELARLFPVWISDIITIDDAIQMIRQIGELTNTYDRAESMTQQIHQARATYETAGLKAKTPAERFKVLYLIWRNPYLSVGGDTFISNMLQSAGFENIMKGRERYPELRPGEIAALEPDLVFLSSEPYPFGEKHIAELQSVCPHSKILLVDGEMFSWYGSRMLHAFDYFTGFRN